MDYDKLSKEIYEQNKAVGWWDNPNRCIYECLQLISTEIAEATEGERKNLMDDHLPHRKMGEVELADALIRTLDLAGRYEWMYTPQDIPKTEFPESIAGKHYALNIALVDIACKLDNSYAVMVSYSAFVDMIAMLCAEQGYDLEGAVAEKLEYNKVRADHKRENRAKEGGKAF